MVRMAVLSGASGRTCFSGSASEAIQSPPRLIVPASPTVFREAFPTRAEADEFALQQAREWIDKRH
jgi:hypothetical protein